MILSIHRSLGLKGSGSMTAMEEQELPTHLKCVSQRGFRV